MDGTCFYLEQGAGRTDPLEVWFLFYIYISLLPSFSLFSSLTLSSSMLSWFSNMALLYFWWSCDLSMHVLLQYSVRLLLSMLAFISLRVFYPWWLFTISYGLENLCSHLISMEPQMFSAPNYLIFPWNSVSSQNTGKNWQVCEIFDSSGKKKSELWTKVPCVLILKVRSL